MSYKRSFLKYLVFVVGIILLSNPNYFVNTQTVCSLDELIKELYDDIVDNGKIIFEYKYIIKKQILIKQLSIY
jgi:hypothetical protein